MLQNKSVKIMILANNMIVIDNIALAYDMW